MSVRQGVFSGHRPPKDNFFAPCEPPPPREFKSRPKMGVAEKMGVANFCFFEASERVSVAIKG